MTTLFDPAQAGITCLGWLARSPVCAEQCFQSNALRLLTTILTTKSQSRATELRAACYALTAQLCSHAHIARAAEPSGMLQAVLGTLIGHAGADGKEAEGALLVMRELCAEPNVRVRRSYLLCCGS